MTPWLEGTKMGYSCTQDASHALGVVSHMFATDGNPNILTIKGKRYFFERGREREDGAITGTLMQMLPDDYCRKAGNVHIDPDGMVRRFPGLTMCDRAEANSTLLDMQARNPHLLSAWACGRI